MQPAATPTAQGTASSADGHRRNYAGPDTETLEYWDTLNGIADGAVADTDLRVGEDVPPEHLLLNLPSNGTISSAHSSLELQLRRRKLNTLLDEIRNLIADESFKYTDEIRTASGEGERTRAVSSVWELDRATYFL